MRIILSELLPRESEHYASEVHFVRWHPAAVWFYERIERPVARLLGRPDRKPYHVVRGRRLHRIKAIAYRIGPDTMVVNRAMMRELNLHAGLPGVSPLDPAMNVQNPFAYDTRGVRWPSSILAPVTLP